MDALRDLIPRRPSLVDRAIALVSIVVAIVIVLIVGANLLTGDDGSPGSSSAGPTTGRSPAPPSAASPPPSPSGSVPPSASASAGAEPSPDATPPPALTPAPTAAPTPRPSVAPTPRPATGFNPARVAVTLKSIATINGRPLAVANAGDGSGRLFIADQEGRIWIMRDGAVLDQPLLDIAGRVSCCGERGLLGIAFHPDFPADPRVFVDYTDNGGDTVVSSFVVPAGTPDRADAGSEVEILTFAQPYANHNGGALAFGMDGFLYISTGDGGSAGDPQGNGQRLDTLLGKILRIDVDAASGGDPYAVPGSNPFVGRSGARGEIWLTGLRNPWRMSFDRTTGDLWIGDVGQGNWEEIDVARSSAGGGANYGWNKMEGNHCYPIGSSCTKTGLTLPATEYNHGGGRCTVIGGGVYRGAAYSILRGGYLFADYCSGTIWGIVASKNGIQSPVAMGSTGSGLAGFGESEDGELYVVNVSNGRLYRIVASAR